MNDALVAQISAAGLVSSTPPERQLSWLGLRPTSGSLVLSPIFNWRVALERLPNNIYTGRPSTWGLRNKKRTWLKEENLGGWFSTLMAFDLSSLQRKSTKLEVLDATQAGVKTFLDSMIYSRSYIWVGKYMMWFHLESNSMREVSLLLLTWYV